MQAGNGEGGGIYLLPKMIRSAEKKYPQSKHFEGDEKVLKNPTHKK